MLEQTLLNALMLGATYIVISSGLTLVFGVLRIFNFAHGELYMLGGFAGYYLMEFAGVNFFLAMMLTITAMFFLGMTVEKFFFRRVRGQMIPGMILSLGLSMGFSGLALILFGEEDFSTDSPFSGVIQLGGTVIAKERLMLIALCFIIMVLLFLFIHKSKFGIAIRAVAQDPASAVLQGVSIDRISLLSFGISSSLAAAAGVMICPVFKVNAFMGLPAIVNSVVVIVLGGMGSIPGCVAGGLLLGFINAFAITYIGGTIGGIFGFIMIIVMIILKPTGIMGGQQ